MAGKKAEKKAVTNRKPKVSGVPKTPEEIQDVRNQVVNLIVDESVVMAERVVRSVSERGNLQALKFLWEVAGMFPANEAAEEGSEDEAANGLLEKLGLCGKPAAEGDESPADVESGESQAGV